MIRFIACAVVLAALVPAGGAAAPVPARGVIQGRVLEPDRSPVPGVTVRLVNPDVYGGVSSVNQLDLRTSYKVHPKLEVAVGMDNVTDHRAYQSHPLPGRTLFLELRSSSR